MSRTVCIIQARMGSTRLPGKIMRPLLGRPMLWWDIHRIRKSRLIDEIVVATTTETQDDETAAFCLAQNWLCFRGSENDVLDRYYQAAKSTGAEVIVRITSDCPVIDPGILDLVVASHTSAAPAPDYTSNTLQRSYPRGLDTEIFSFNALERAWQEDHSAGREHVTPYIYNHPQEFRLNGLVNPVDYSNHRWTVDTPEDFELIEHIYNAFGHGDFSWRNVLALLDEKPEWVAINSHIEQKTG